jgi:cytochrome c oxidase subunit 3
MSGRTERERTAFVGMTLALGSLAMLFASLLFSYAVVRYHASVWPPEGVARLPRALPAFGTLVLVASSLVLLRKTRGALAAAIALGTLFLCVQLAVWVPLWRSGLTIASGVYGSVFYALSGVHALLAVAGLGALGASLGDIAWRRPSAMLWHFVVLAWVVCFVAVYMV